MCALQSCLTACDPMDYWFLCPWDSPAKNTGVGYHALLQGFFWIQESNPRVLCFVHWQADSLPPAPLDAAINGMKIKRKKKEGKHHCHLPSSDPSLASHWMNEPTHSLRKVIPCHSNQGRRNLRNRLQVNPLTGQPLEKLRAAAVRKVRAIIWGQSV